MHLAAAAGHMEVIKALRVSEVWRFRGSGFRVWRFRGFEDLGFRVQRFRGFGVYGLGARGFRVSGCNLLEL